MIEVLMSSLAAVVVAGEPTPNMLTPVPIQQVSIDDEFWSPKRKVWREVTIADCFDKFEHDRGGAINNFDLVRDGKSGGHAGPPWYDGLIYEMIRGSADFLAEGYSGQAAFSAPDPHPGPLPSREMERSLSPTRGLRSASMATLPASRLGRRRIRTDISTRGRNSWPRTSGGG